MKRKLYLLTLLTIFFISNAALSQQWNPTHPGWTDSFQANGFCWCNSTNFDHGIGNKTVAINGTAYKIIDICDELKKHPLYRAYQNGDAPYNDIQCGNGPANDAPDETGCPGRTDLGPSGCKQIGPKWDMDWLKARPRFGGDGNGGGDNTGPEVSFTTPQNNISYNAPATIEVVVNATDNSGISNVKLFINDVFVRQENVNPYEWNQNNQDQKLQNLAVGNYTLKAEATDTNGNVTTKMLTFTVNQTQQWNPTHPGWTDSFQANGFCWCNSSNFDHGIGDKTVTINGTAYKIIDICDELKKHPLYRAYQNGDAPYNDIQCGNGPANDAPDETGCPGRTDLGPSGCNQIGPKWDMEWLNTRPRFGGGNSNNMVTILGQSINKYISSENGTRSMRANRSNAGAAENFTIENLGNNVYAFKGNNGKYVSSENGTKAMNCNRNAIGSWEKFILEPLGNDLYAIKGNNGKYVSHENGREMGIFCNRNAVGSWEKFIIPGLNSNTTTSSRNTISTSSLKGIAVFPNPSVMNDLNLQITSLSNEFCTIEVVNMNGKKVFAKNLGVIKAGTTPIMFKDFKLPINTQGLYILKVTIGKDSFTEQIVIQ